MPEPPARVLVVDDNAEVLTALQMLLEGRGFTVRTAKRPDAIPALLEDEEFAAVLLDMNFREDVSSGREGFRWLANVLQIDPSVAVVMITAYGDIHKAVRAMKEGASDFVVKPWSDEDLVRSVREAIEVKRSQGEAERARTKGPDSGAPSRSDEATDALDEIIGDSEAMQAVFAKIEKVAPTDANVLLLGENGTGKELAARALHWHSEREGGPFVMADLGALSESLFESELFGHVEGAFTGADEDRAGRFEAASGGTLFLDEIGNIPLSLQAKLLTVLQRREVARVGSVESKAVDIRLVSATNRPIYEHVEESSFRQDLLYRINTVEIQLPPLRERNGDVSLLADHFLQEYTRKYQRSGQHISKAAKNKLETYHWPGNVRELRHTVERAVILSEQAMLGPEDFRFSAPKSSAAGGKPVSDTLDLEEVEQATVRRALSKHGGNVSRAADDLGISRRALYRRIEKYGL